MGLRLTWTKAIGPCALVIVLTAVAVRPISEASAGIPERSAQPQVTSPAFPTFVQLPADQAAHTGATYEWWYTVGHVKAGGRLFGYEITLTMSAGTPETHLAITDQTTGRYYQQVKRYRPDEVSVSPDKLDVRMPDAGLTGTMPAMSIRARLPEANLNFTLRHSGPALYPVGTGLIPFLGGQSYYYSLPSLTTTGTLTLDGHTYQVSGESWLDRQWGNWDWSKLNRWTWMAVQLSNGDRLNLWDMLSTEGENPYATVLHRDGHLSVVPIVPLADDASDVWKSPATGQRYPTHWVIRIPSMRTTLEIRAYPQEQEVLINYPGVTPSMYEGAATVTGSHDGRQVTGHAYVEQIGKWS